MRLSHLALSAVMLSGTLVASACSISRERSSDATDSAVAAAPATAPSAPEPPGASSSTNTPLAPGDVRITTTDGGLDLLLIGDRIAVKLSDSVLAQVGKKLDTTKATNGFGAFIEKTVKSTVSSALATRVEYPLADIKDVRYEDGTLVIEPRSGSKTRILDGTKVNGRPAMESFAPADAQRFAEAARAKLRRM